jgi:signal transduction histidine kinase
MTFLNKHINVLIIEDSDGDMLLFETYLNHTSLNMASLHKAFSLKDVSDAVPKDIDIAFLDLSLPDSQGMDSFNTLKRIMPEVPIVVLSGMADLKLAVECISKGAQDYLMKNDLTYVMLEKSIQYSIERKKNLDSLIRQQLNSQKQITEAAIIGQEKEKEAIGKELHDNINQILASVKLYLDTAIRNEDIRDELLQKSRENVNIAIDQIRKLSHSLIAPPLTEISLREAVSELVTELNVLAKFKVSLNAEHLNEILLNDNKKLMLYRIIQEQITNIIKHAKANHVDITFNSLPSMLILTIEDDGIGFDPSVKAKGIGLRNIENRISYYTGKVDIHSARGKGTSMTVYLPS